MKSSFRTNLLAGFGISLFLLLASSIASYYSIINLIQSGDMVDHTQSVILKSEEIISEMKDAETGQRGYLLTNDVAYLEPYNGSYERAQRALRELKDLTSDNLTQQQNCGRMEKLINQRFSILQASIDNRRANLPVEKSTLNEGKKYMDDARTLIDTMQAIERDLLQKRNADLKRYTTYAPVVIIVAAVLSLLITVLFFRRVNEDYREKAEMSASLEKKDREIAHRISVIQDVAQQVAGGDYNIRLDNEANDNLGSLAGSLNRMTASLHESFSRQADNEWLQTGRAQFGKDIGGEKSVHALASDIISSIAEYTGSETGAFYVVAPGDNLVLEAGYALPAGYSRTSIKSGEGIAGQCVRDRKELLLKEIDEDLYVEFSGGVLKPKEVVALPVLFEGEITAVIELGTLRTYRELDLRYMRSVSEIAGVALNTAQNRRRLSELLEETQAQAEELQAQHSELENINVELEAQAEKLQTSEEELRVQQEELMEANHTLEERSKLLEEKNKLIAMRNIDIQKKAEELALSTRYKSEFLANMSHELRTPLNSILLLSRLLADNNKANLNAEQVEYAQVIQSSGNSLLTLIDEILDLSKIESGKLELSYETVSIGEIESSMRGIFLPMARDKGIGFSIHKEAGVPAQIESDRLRLEQILKNLLSNALKFTATGEIKLDIRPSATFSGFIDFSVQDTGIGIPREKHQAIFEAFQQADGSTKRNYGGTGLGLSISRQLARLLSGDILLQSEEGKGSIFTLSIPASRGAAEEIMRMSTTSAAEEVIQEMPDSFVTDNLRNRFIAPEIPEEIPDDRDKIRSGDRVLLIVEDDTAFAKALLDFVRQKGYKGVVIVRGDQALDMARLYRPAGIMLDIQLPVKSGLEVMDELKKDPLTRPIPVHIISSYELKKETISKGAIDFIDKPTAAHHMDAILQRIEGTIKNDRKKVLIVEDNTQHAKALAYFLSNNNIRSEISADVAGSVQSISQEGVNCVIMDMGIPAMQSYETLDLIKKNEAFTNVPIIIFTGKSLSRAEEQRIRQYADSIVIKTAHSYQRILDEVSLFLHVMDEEFGRATGGGKKFGVMDNVLKGKTVLVTDDDVRNIFALGKALEKHQMEVITTTDGKEALKALRENPSIDIVLMDIMMPEMDGYETIMEIRKDPRWKRLPVIAVTAKAMTGDREKCIQAGASDYITKPVDTDQLVSLMRIWLQENMK